MKPEAIIRKWQQKLFLNEWRFTLVIEQQEVGDDSPDTVTLAYINADPSYLMASIHIFPAFFKCSKQEQEEALVHELCHCYTQELYNMCKQLATGNMISQGLVLEAVERATQRITNIAYRGTR